MCRPGKKEISYPSTVVADEKSEYSWHESTQLTGFYYDGNISR